MNAGTQLVRSKEEECGRCGGTGEVCYSSTSYGKCYDCGGSGVVKPRWHKVTKKGHAGAYFFRVDCLAGTKVNDVRRSLVGIRHYDIQVMFESELPQLRHFEDVEGVQVFYQASL